MAAKNDQTINFRKFLFDHYDQLLGLFSSACRKLLYDSVLSSDINVHGNRVDEDASSSDDCINAIGNASSSPLSNVKKYALVFIGSKNTSDLPLLDQLQDISKNKCKHFSTAQQSATYIMEIKEQVIVVTTDGKQVASLLSSCGNLPQLKAIYVLKTNVESIIDRRVEYFHKSSSLLHQIQIDMLLCDQDPLAFSYYDLNQRSLRYLTEEGASFLWTYMLIDVLKLIPANSYSISDIINLCQECYHDCPAQLALIRKFGDTYAADKALEWYTRDCFLYRVLNKILRTENIEALYIFRTYIADVCAQLEENKRLYCCSHEIMIVYRGQLMLQWELTKLKNSIGHLVSVNAFFSATRDENVAMIFAGDESDYDYLKSVIFEIEVDTRLRHTLFAPISHLGNMNAEDEILFSLSTVFKIIDVLPQQHHWRIYLQATDEGRDLYDEYKKLESLNEECPTVEILFGRLLMSMGQPIKALKYGMALIKRLNTHDIIDHAAITCLQSECLYIIGKFKEAIQCSRNGITLLRKRGMSSKHILYLRCRFYLARSLALTYKVREARVILETTLHEQQQNLHKHHEHIADTLKLMGLLKGYETGYDKALQLRTDALRIYQEILPKNHPKCIEATVSVAGSYRYLGNFRIALDYLEKAISVQEQFLIDDHSSRGATLREIGLTYEALGQFDVAFDNYLQAYSIWMRQFPDGHVYTVFCLNKIGGIYRMRKQFKEALECQKCALEMHASLFKKGTRHPIHEMGKTYLDMGENKNAIKTFRLARAYWLTKTSDRTNIDLNGTESYLATAYSHAGRYKQAQKLFEKVISLQKNSRPNGNLCIGYTLHHMGSNLQRMSQLNDAIECYKESIRMLSKFLADDHIEVKMVCEKMKMLQTILQIDKKSDSISI
ncbi:unnamed protein product [Adineta steineri]|uniref:NAD(P)(+)--arginine ADP-ribosyltransferase n=1 Tax=Adineta steineri TaxID=433720 RepID=A0A815HDR3_9BILA|nr:unnamed protein product [Adineta steineri]CAF3783396.1 unnamed protein product [Adineta steineri]